MGGTSLIPRAPPTSATCGPREEGVSPHRCGREASCGRRHAWSTSRYAQQERGQLMHTDEAVDVVEAAHGTVHLRAVEPRCAVSRGDQDLKQRLGCGVRHPQRALADESRGSWRRPTNPRRPRDEPDGVNDGEPRSLGGRWRQLVSDGAALELRPAISRQARRLGRDQARSRWQSMISTRRAQVHHALA